MKLGNDFTDDGEQNDTSSKEEEVKDDSDDKSEEEKENSADSSDSKTESSDESTDGEKTDDDEEEKSSDDSKEKTPDKSAVLQGLLETEKDIAKSTEDVDAAIAAARARISQKRGERREKRDLAGTIDSKFPEEENQDDLSDIDTETLKVLDRYTKSKGLVPKTELQKLSYQERHKAAEENFYEKHPEYSPEHDSDDVLYNALKKELSFFATPSDPKLISKLFEKAHNEVSKLYPNKFQTRRAESNSDSNANKGARIKSRSLGGSSSGSGGKSSDDAGGSKKSFSEVQIRALQDGGWSTEEIKKLTQ